MQSREYLEQRRVNQLLKEAQRAALSIKDEVKVTEALAYSLELTSSRLRSVSQSVLYDPSLQAEPDAMREGEPPPIDLASVGELLAQSEIDFRTLKEHVCSLLEQRDQASIGDVLKYFPAEQGLGSVVGLLALGSRHGIRGSRASIEKIKKHSILRKIRASEDRFEISPTLKLLFSAEEIQALTRVYHDMHAAEALSKHNDEMQVGEGHE